MRKFFKRGWALGLALALCLTGTSAFAANTDDENTKWTTREVPMPAIAAENAKHFYWRENGGDDTKVYRNSGDVAAACNAIMSLNDRARVELNVSNIPTADMVFEFYMENGDFMRYNVYSNRYFGHSDRIILQRTEDGQSYAGMGFTGGNVTEVVNKLWDVVNQRTETESGMAPFILDASDVASINVIFFDSLTYTPITSRDSIKYIINLFRASNPTTLRDNSSLGGVLPDIGSIYIVLNDGTRVACNMALNGMIVAQTPTRLNVAKTSWVKLDSTIQSKLLTALRERKGTPRPAWFGTINPENVSSATIIPPRGANARTLNDDDPEIEMLIQELQSTEINSNSMVKSTKTSGISDAYTIRLNFMNGTRYTIEYGTSKISIKASDISYTVTYSLSNRRPDAMLDQLL